MKDRSLSVILVTLFMVVMGFLRTFIQLLIVNFNLKVFLTPPFLLLIPLTLSLSYIVAGILTFISWRLGSTLSIIAIGAQVSTEFYMAISHYGTIVLTDLILIYSLDLLISIYLIRSLVSRKKYIKTCF